MFNVRNGRLVATCELPVLEHRMVAPTSIDDDGQTLSGCVESDDDRRYEILLDVESGKQHDKDGRLVESVMPRQYWVRSGQANLEVEGCRHTF